MTNLFLVGAGPRPLPAIMELYLEDDPAICAEFRARVQARVQTLRQAAE